MFAETSGSKAEHDEEKLNLFLEEMLEKGSGFSSVQKNPKVCAFKKYFFTVSDELSKCPKEPKKFARFKK